MDTQFFIITLTAILLMPLVPAFLLYKFLPSKTNVGGPFKGLSLKLTGAFAGYFLLVLAATGVFFYLIKNEQAKAIDSLQNELASLRSGGQDEWVMYGKVASTSPRETSMFFDKSGAQFEQTGDFELPFTVPRQGGKKQLPKSVCIYNSKDGFRVINLNKESPNNSDIRDLDIRFDDSTRTIQVAKAINIQSKEDDRVKAESALIEKIKNNQVDIGTYKPTRPRYVVPESLQVRIQPQRLRPVLRPQQ